MKSLEKELIALVTMEAQPTKAFTEHIYKGQPSWRIAQARPHVLRALTALEDDGVIESRMCKQSYSGHVSRYWALPGGRFPQELDVKELATRVVLALSIRPMNLDQLYDTVYYQEEQTDFESARKRLNKALYRLQDKGTIIKDSGSRTACWRLQEASS